MSAPEVESCPFCNCKMHVRSNRDWHRIVGHHDRLCPLREHGYDAVIVPATDSHLEAMVKSWNRRLGHNKEGEVSNASAH